MTISDMIEYTVTIVVETWQVILIYFLKRTIKDDEKILFTLDFTRL